LNIINALFDAIVNIKEGFTVLNFLGLALGVLSISNTGLSNLLACVDTYI